MQLPVLALVIALLSFGSAYAADENADENAAKKKENRAHGVWMTDKGRSKVKVGLCEEAQGLCSEIVWLREPNNSRGVPLTDGRNQNTRLRKRPIMGLKILEGLKQIGRYEWEGSVYNPEDGKTYKANLALVKPDMLRLKGCMSMGWPCRSKFWTRSELEPSAPEQMMVEAVELTELGADPAAAGGVAQQQPQPPAAAQAPAQVQTASREAQMALTPPVEAAPPAVNPEPAPRPQLQVAIEPSQPAQSAPAAAPAPAPAAPDNQAVSRPAPATTLQPAPAAPSNRAVSPPPQPSQRAYEPPSRTVALPPPPPPPPPAVAAAPAQPQRQAAVVEPPAAPPARTAAPPPPPPAAAQQPTRPDVYPDVAALPSEPALRRGGDGSNYLVQVAARQDRNEAVAVFNDLRRRYPRLLGSAQPIIKRVNLGELGVWYRVRIGPIAGKAAALSLCNRLKFAGSDCFIRRE